MKNGIVNNAECGQFNVVAMGTSLGGLQAVELILHEIPENFASPIVIVQHRGGDRSSRLVSLWQRYSKLPIGEPEDKEAIEPGRVYVAPSDYHLLIERGYFSLSLDPPEQYARPSIDVLFESVARSYRRAAVGVLLTGANRDGANGLRAIKQHGGRVIVQDPETADSPIMPRAGVEATCVTSIVPLHRIAAVLIAVCCSQSNKYVAMNV